MTDWPASLPQLFLKGSIKIEEPDNVKATEMEAGPPQRRRLSLAGERAIRGSMSMSTAQFLTLRTFYHDTVKAVLPFNFPNPDDDGATTIECVFQAPPTRVDRSPGRWTVQIALGERL